MAEYRPSLEDLLLALEQHERWCEREVCPVCNVWLDALRYAEQRAALKAPSPKDAP